MFQLIMVLKSYENPMGHKCVSISQVRLESPSRFYHFNVIPSESFKIYHREIIPLLWVHALMKFMEIHDKSQI